MVQCEPCALTPGEKVLAESDFEPARLTSPGQVVEHVCALPSRDGPLAHKFHPARERCSNTPRRSGLVTVLRFLVSEVVLDSLRKRNMLDRLRLTQLHTEPMRVSELPDGSEVFSCSFESSHDHYAWLAVDLKPVSPATVLDVDARSSLYLVGFLACFWQ